MGIKIYKANLHELDELIAVIKNTYTSPSPKRAELLSICNSRREFLNIKIKWHENMSGEGDCCCTPDDDMYGGGCGYYR